jgi:hypothetical protein
MSGIQKPDSYSFCSWSCCCSSRVCLVLLGRPGRRSALRAARVSSSRRRYFAMASWTSTSVRGRSGSGISSWRKRMRLTGTSVSREGTCCASRTYGMHRSTFHAQRPDVQHGRLLQQRRADGERRDCSRAEPELRPSSSTPAFGPLRIWTAWLVYLEFW